MPSLTSTRTVGPQDTCVQCGESKAKVRASQQAKDPIYCGTVDLLGESAAAWDRHRFRWSAKDQARHDVEEAAIADDMGRFADFVNSEPELAATS